MALDGFDGATVSERNASGFNQFGDAFAQIATDGTFVQILQVEGPQSERVEVILGGRSLPYDGVGWSVEQHTKQTWYPGNPVATQQVLGPREQNTVFKGKWKDRFIGGTIAVNGDVSEIDTAEKAVLLFYDLARVGKRVRVQWLSEIRTGVIKAFSPTWDRAQDVEWELEFEWSSRNDEVAPRAAADPGPASDLLNGANNLEDIFSLAPDAAARLEASLLDSIHSVRDRVRKVFGALRAVETLINLPATVLGTIRADINSLRNELLEFGHRLDAGRSSTFDDETNNRVKFGTVRSGLTQRSGVGSPAQVPGAGSGFASKTSAAPTTSADVEELKFETWRRSTARAARTLLFTLQQQLLAVENRAQPALNQVRPVREGETLYSIAADIYGSPDFANWLAQNNRINTVTPPPGTILRIPPRPLSASQRVEINVVPKQICSTGD